LPGKVSAGLSGHGAGAVLLLLRKLQLKLPQSFGFIHLHLCNIPSSFVTLQLNQPCILLTDPVLQSQTCEA
jgi:hypothetical protein